MQLNKTKKSIMAFAAMLVAIFHVWMPISAQDTVLGQVERFIIATAYIGVDLFFLLSGYALARAGTEPLRVSLKRRWARLYPVFAIGCVAAVLLGTLPLSRLATTLVGIDFLRHGGASFLWFLPALMLWYIVFPVGQRLLSGFRPLTRGLLAVGLWLCAVFVASWGLRGVIDINIFLCRIPAILVGTWIATTDARAPMHRRVLIGTILLIAGIAVVYPLGFRYKLDIPFEGAFYVAALPMVVGLTLLLDALFTVKRCRMIETIGSATLELYVLQMVVGAKLVQALYALTHHKLLTDLLTLALLILGSILLSRRRQSLTSRRAGRASAGE